MTPSLLYGIHDREGRHIVPLGGWCLDLQAISEKPQPTDYAALRGDINWIVRLSWGYGSTGTIPLPAQYQEFADGCADYVFSSKGANVFIISNEPNHENERPNGTYITPAQYVDCFIKCRDAIKRAKPLTQVLPAPCAPYHADPTDWLAYWREMLNLIAAHGGCDGIPFHAYTRSSNPADITSPAKMGPPLQNQYSGFLTYQDALDAVPLKLGHLPAYGTEFNEILPGGWDDANTGVVQAAYAEIDEWNRSEGRLPIQCLILYRWPKNDKYYIQGKRGVIADFQAAVGRGYTSPTMGATPVPNTTFIPAVSTGTQVLALPPRDIDQRLIDRGVHFEYVTPPAGTWYWRMTKAQWLDKAAQQVGPDHHILGRVLKQSVETEGVPLRVEWSSGNATVVSKKDDPNATFNYDYAMSASLNEYAIQVADGNPSDRVTGIGMGKGGNSKEHTSTWITFEWTIADGVKPPTPTPTPEPPTPPTPSPPGKLIWPVQGPITQYFGAHDIAYPGLPGHDGLDFGVPVGTPVLAVADGKVMYVAEDAGGFGLYVRIYHPAHGFHSFMGHLSKQLVTPGQMVKQGQKVALSGNTGNSTGPHLHYSTRLGSETAYFDLHDGYRNGCANPLAVYALINVRTPAP